jgi:MFS transporter, PAT family, beta-lactamase induction signal transducer AmpG
MDRCSARVGYVDAFRVVDPRPDQYTWWSNRGQAWAKNVGWRIDYQVVHAASSASWCGPHIYKEQRFSDHAPLIMDYVAHEAHVVALIERVAWLKGWMAGVVAWLYVAAIAPFAEFMRRRGWVLILFFIVFFKFGDALLGRMSGVFYREMGFDYLQIAEVMKLYGFLANGIGVLAGGVLVARLGVFRALLVAGFLAAATNLTYSWLAMSGQDWTVFIIAVVTDNFAMGLSSVAFVAYVSSLCNVAYTATQYALLASAGNIARIWLSASSGWMVDTLDGDWAVFFLLTALIAMLALPLVLVMMRYFPEVLARASDKDRQ